MALGISKYNSTDCDYFSFFSAQVVYNAPDVPSIILLQDPKYSICGSDQREHPHRDKRQRVHICPGAFRQQCKAPSTDHRLHLIFLSHLLSIIQPDHFAH